MSRYFSPIKAITAAAAGVMLASCTSTTPLTRIEANPQIYASLSSEEKALVQRGEISKGMKPPAVFLAWGEPHVTSGGVANGKQFEKWSYTRAEPAGTTRYGLYGGYGFGSYYPRYRRHGRRGYYSPYYGINVAPQIIYRQETYAQVEFLEGRVDSYVRRSYGRRR